MTKLMKLSDQDLSIILHTLKFVYSGIKRDGKFGEANLLQAVIIKIENQLK